LSDFCRLLYTAAKQAVPTRKLPTPALLQYGATPRLLKLSISLGRSLMLPLYLLLKARRAAQHSQLVKAVICCS
jgi:hypothetical protein